MKKLMTAAAAVMMSIFVLGAGQQSALADVTAPAIAGLDSHALKDGAIPVRWGYRRWYGGWGGPGPFFFAAPLFWGAPWYWGPACRWHCGPYRCWRACW